VAVLTCRFASVRPGFFFFFCRASNNTTYSLGSRSGHSVLEFAIDRVGRYDFACDYGGNTGPQTVVAVGAGVGEALVRLVASSVLSVLAGVGLCLTVVVIVTLTRYRVRKRTALYGRMPM
jgi:hypothetical protein